MRTLYLYCCTLSPKGKARVEDFIEREDGLSRARAPKCRLTRFSQMIFGSDPPI